MGDICRLVLTGSGFVASGWRNLRGQVGIEFAAAKRPGCGASETELTATGARPNSFAGPTDRHPFARFVRKDRFCPDDFRLRVRRSPTRRRVSPQRAVNFLTCAESPRPAPSVERERRAHSARLQPAASGRHPHQIHAAAKTELFHGARAIRFHRLDADIQIAGHFLVGVALRDQSHHRVLAPA